MKPVVCAVGTTEPWGAAGLTLDLRVLHDLGAHPLCVVTAVSAQHAGGVRGLFALPLEAVRAQFDALADAPLDALRVGALPTIAIARECAARLAAAGKPAVYDPALAASGGGALANDDPASIVWSVLAHATVVTPNVHEAGVLLGRSVRDVAGMRAAAAELVARGARAALVKGGHLAGTAVDVLCDERGLHEFAAPRLDLELRGTGCLLADALAVALARGMTLREAVAAARAYVRNKLEDGITLGGMRLAD